MRPERSTVVDGRTTSIVMGWSNSVSALIDVDGRTASIPMVIGRSGSVLTVLAVFNEQHQMAHKMRSNFFNGKRNIFNPNIVFKKYAITVVVN